MNAVKARVATWEGFLIALVVAAGLVAILTVPNFGTTFNLAQAAADMSEKGLLVLPLALLLIAGEIDLSIASTLALSTVVLGMLMREGVPLETAIPTVLLIGALAGAFNGLLVVRLGFSSLIATLGTLSLYRGIAYMLLGSGSITEFPDSFLSFGIEAVPGTQIPWTVVPMLVLAPIFALVLHRTAAGRRVFAIGGNADAALFAGIRVGRIRFLLFTLSGVISALAGIVYATRIGSGRADAALGYELDVITIALLGGVSVFGGRGSLVGVAASLLLIATIRNILGLENIGGDAQGTAIGLILIVSLLLSNLASSLSARFRARREFGTRPPPPLAQPATAGPGQSGPRQ